jgi:hypothetical protein
MDHIVYVDTKAKELEKLLEGTKRMIIRGAAGRKMPYGRVHLGDILYLIRNNAEGEIKARATVKNVFNSDKMTKEESAELINENQDVLQLSSQQEKRWAGKRYLVLIEVEDVSEIEPFSVDKSDYGNMDDWLPVEDINNVKIIK